MNKYVVAYMSFYDNNLKQQIVISTSPMQAAVKCLEKHCGYASELVEDLLDICGDDLEALSTILFNHDIVLSVKEV